MHSNHLNSHTMAQDAAIVMPETKDEYHALAHEQNNTLRLKRLKRGHVGNGHGGNGNDTGKGNGKGPTLKSPTRSIVALATRFDKFKLPDDDDDSSEEEEGTSNRSNAALARQIKKKKRGGNIKENISAFEMCLGSVIRVEEVNRSDLNLHADCFVCGKVVLVFNDFDP
jgi:hypothetical protein